MSKKHDIIERARGAAGRFRGFTIIELVITLAIIGMLASMAVPTGQMMVKRSREQELRVVLREIRAGIDAYRQAVADGRVETKPDASGFPPSLDVLVQGVPNQRDPNKANIYFMRRIPRDPFCTDSTLSDQDTWALRSYASGPDEPAPGDDVYDVYSRSKGVGLNGIPYAKW